MSAVVITPMSPKTPDTTTRGSPPPTGTLSAPRYPAAYRIGSSHIGRPNCCLKPDMAQHQTVFMREGSQSRPPPTRPPSTRKNAPSSSSRSAYARTSTATLNSRRRKRNNPPSWQPSKNVRDGWSSLPFPSATRVPHSSKP